MVDELLPYYEKELAYIRKLGAAFAKENPKIAGQIGIHDENIEDPHASRLIESFAYLNARIQHKLDDEIPELTDGILSIVYPHYQRPIPSMSIVQFKPDKDQLDAPFKINKDTLLETTQFKGETCKFSTCYDTTLLPITLKEAKLIGKPFGTPGGNTMRYAQSVLKLKLKTFNDGLSFNQLSGNRLRLHLRGQSQFIHPLYQLFLRNCIRIYSARSENDSQPSNTDSHCIYDVGFKHDENLLPYPKNAFLGYRLLTEYFAYAEKFMFIDIDLSKVVPTECDDFLYLYFYFDETDIELEHGLDEKNIAMGCTPCINLFQYKTDPIKIDHTRSEYQILPDVRQPKGYEIYCVNDVSTIDQNMQVCHFPELYGQNHRDENKEFDSHHRYDTHVHYVATRRPAKLGLFERDHGTDVYLSFTDLAFNPEVPEYPIINVETLCSNRDTPAKLPFEHNKLALQCIEGEPPCEAIFCIQKPSETIRPPLGNGARWRLISHINLNFLSISGGESSLNAFKGILKLYDFRESSVTQGLINSIVDLHSKAISIPINLDGYPTICRGTEITLTLDKSLLSGNSAYLFASVLEHFFALYCPTNSFTRTLVKVKGQEGYLKKCPPRSGEKVLL